MRIIFASFPEAEYQAVILSYEGANDRLLSYAYTRVQTDEFIQTYIKEGQGPDKVKAK